MLSLSRVYPMPTLRRNPNWFFGDDFFKPFQSVTPMHAGVRETETSYLFDAELPGFEPEEINILVEDGVLTITAEQNKSSEDKNMYTARSVRRSFTIDGINEDGIAAEYKNGVLHLTQPKENVPETKQPRKIEITNAGKALPEQ